MLWIHDIPEMFDDYDVSYVHRYNNKELEVDTQQKEFKIAKKILKNSDLQLFLEFQEAELYLGKFHKKSPSNPYAVLAKLIDLIDGNLVYYFYYIKAVLNGSVEDGNYTTFNFDFVFDQYKNISQKISDLNCESDYKKDLLGLYKSSITTNYNMWVATDVVKFLPKRQKGLARLKKLVQNI
jgi:hypothetical protein